MLHLLAELVSVPERTTVTERAEAVVATLLQDRQCKKVLRPILRKLEEGAAPSHDNEDDLLKPGSGGSVQRAVLAAR